jgi:hypothetical protein
MPGDVVPAVGAVVRFREPGADRVQEGTFMRVEQRLGFQLLGEQRGLVAMGPPIWHVMVGESHWQIRSTWVVDEDR